MSCPADDFGPIALANRGVLEYWAAGAFCRPKCGSRVSSHGEVFWVPLEAVRCGVEKLKEWRGGPL
jgi:hypothetical protein